MKQRMEIKEMRSSRISTLAMYANIKDNIYTCISSNIFVVGD